MHQKDHRHREDDLASQRKSQAHWNQEPIAEKSQSEQYKQQSEALSVGELKHGRGRVNADGQHRGECHPPDDHPAS